MKTIKNTKEFRREIAIANLCRGWLYINGFLTEREMNNVHKKILKYRDKHNIIISEAQLCSAAFVYDDNAKDQ